MFVYVIISTVLGLHFEVYALPPAKIIGGHNASEGSYPSFAVIRYYSPQLVDKCGGTVLNKRYILTAAHCIENKDLDHLTIYVGSIFYGAGVEYKIKKIIRYKTLNDSNYHDIALLKTTKDIEFNERVKAVKLPTDDITEHGHSVKAIGFGLQTPYGSSPYILQEIALKICDQKKCKMESSKVNDNSKMCTLTKLGEGLCHGDSGGPLLINDIQVGVFISMVPCAKGKPDIFSRVYYYIDWITENIKL